MAITKKTEIDKIEIVGEFRHIQIRQATVIEEDGAELSRSFQRRVINPGDDTQQETDEVQALVAAVHTPELIARYAASQDAAAEAPGDD